MIVDDHTVMRDCLKMVLDAQMDLEVVGVAACGEDALQLVNDLKPDVIVMDVLMPGLGGAATTKRIKELFPQIKILVFSAYEDDVYIRQLLAVGAAGYVLKIASLDTFLNAVKIVSSGGIYIDPFIASKLLHLTERFHCKTESPLSRREEQVLQLAARGIPNKEIAEIVGVGVKTIETYKTRSYKKLNFNSRSDLVRYASIQGWFKTERVSD